MRHAKSFWPAVKNDPFNNRINPFGPPNYPDSWTVKRSWTADEETPFERTRILNPAPSQKAMRIIKKSFDRAFPQFKGWTVSGAWAGLIDTMPDVVPIIDRCSDIPGLTIATGMSGHGFGIGPGVGRLVADMMSGKQSNHMLHRFRYDRFKNGDPIILSPAL
jgi:glycine/D-amino acid oxidase-like deaminating enzyme